MNWRGAAFLCNECDVYTISEFFFYTSLESVHQQSWSHRKKKTNTPGHGSIHAISSTRCSHKCFTDSHDFFAQHVLSSGFVTSPSKNHWYILAKLRRESKWPHEKNPQEWWSKPQRHDQLEMHIYTCQHPTSYTPIGLQDTSRKAGK